VKLVRIYAGKARIGKGMGTALMRACLDEAASRGCDTIWLGVWERNERAQEFYRKWGFEEAGTQAFQLGAEMQTDRLMQKTVG
jgi:ribosomal protein S18 acetylase RimI-like enzyme